MLPLVRRSYVGFPEWPSPALRRPCRVDGAAGVLVVKHTIAVRSLAQASAAMSDACVHCDYFVERLAEQFGNGGDFVIAHPHEPRRSSAAMAAHGALKTQAGVIPRFFRIAIHAVDLRNFVSVSIIIPTWNEAASIAETIRSLRTQEPGEIIVVDGG